MKASGHAFKRPWLSAGLLKSIKKKYKLYKKFLNFPTPTNEENYKKYRNKSHHPPRLAKSLYYEEKLESLKKNAKGTWKILNQIINKNHRSSKLPSTFTINNLEISDPSLIANQFCNSINNLEPTLAKKIPSSIRAHKSFLPDRLHNSFFLESTTQSEIVETANSLRLNTAAGHDKIPMWSVEESINYISEPLTYVLNLSINSVIIPAQMKLARVVSLYI